jgi:hypothetical protein
MTAATALPRATIPERTTELTIATQQLPRRTLIFVIDGTPEVARGRGRPCAPCHLTTRSWPRAAGGSRRTNHVTTQDITIPDARPRSGDAPGTHRGDRHRRLLPWRARTARSRSHRRVRRPQPSRATGAPPSRGEWTRIRGELVRSASGRPRRPCPQTGDSRANARRWPAAAHPELAPALHCGSARVMRLDDESLCLLPHAFSADQCDHAHTPAEELEPETSPAAA